MSLTRTVPAVVPSVFHSSRPWMPSSAVKNSVPPARRVGRVARRGPGVARCQQRAAARRPAGLGADDRPAAAHRGQHPPGRPTAAAVAAVAAMRLVSGALARTATQRLRLGDPRPQDLLARRTSSTRHLPTSPRVVASPGAAATDPGALPVGLLCPNVAAVTPDGLTLPVTLRPAIWLPGISTPCDPHPHAAEHGAATLRPLPRHRRGGHRRAIRRGPRDHPRGLPRSRDPALQRPRPRWARRARRRCCRSRAMHRPRRRRSGRRHPRAGRRAVTGSRGPARPQSCARAYVLCAAIMQL